MTFERTTGVLFLMCFAGLASADLIVEYDGVEGSAISGNAGTDVMATFDLTRGPGVVENSGANFNSRDWLASDLAGAIAAGDYLSFGFTPATGFIADVDEVLVELDRSGTGPTTVELLSSVDGFSVGSSLGSAAVPNPGSIVTFDLSLMDITAATEFRLYAYGASSASGTMDIEDDLIGGAVGLRVNGTVVAIPEPTAALFGSLLAAGLGLTVARRSQNRD